MLNSLLADSMAAFQSVFMSGDMISLAIAVVIIIALAFGVRGGNFVTMGALGLALFGAAQVARSALGPQGPEAAGNPWLSQLNSGWDGFMSMSAGSLVAYLIVFTLAIVIVGLGKSVIFRD